MELDKHGIGQRIKNIRLTSDKLQKHTMEELAEKVNSNKSNVSRWERGKNIPNDITIKKIAELGEISPNELLYGRFPEYAYSLLKADISNKGEYYNHFVDRYSRRMMISKDHVNQKIALKYLDSNKEAILNKIFKDIQNMTMNHILNKQGDSNKDFNDALYSDVQVVSVAKRAIDKLMDYRRTYPEYINDLEEAIDSIGHFETRYDLQQLTDRYIKRGLNESDAKIYALNDYYISKITTSISSSIDSTTEEYNEEKNRLDK